MKHPSIEDPINHLDIGYKESIVALLLLVQVGKCSCRKAATLLMEEHNKAFVSYAEQLDKLDVHEAIALSEHLACSLGNIVRFDTIGATRRDHAETAIQALQEWKANKQLSTKATQ